MTKKSPGLSYPWVADHLPGDCKEAHGPELGRPCLQSMPVTQENLPEAFTFQAALALALTGGYNIRWLVFPHRHGTGHSPLGALFVIFPWGGGRGGWHCGGESSSRLMGRERQI